MKKTFILRQFLVMVFTLITFAGFAQINANGGFETWTNGLPDGWKGNKSNITVSNIIQVTDAHTGNYACMLKTVNSNKRFTTQPMNILANQQYTISYWVKGHGKIMTGVTDGGSTYNYTNNWRDIDSPTFIQFVDTVLLNETVSIGEFIFGVKDLSTQTGNDSLIIDDVEINFYPPTDENTVATPIISLSGTQSGTEYVNSATVSILTTTSGASIYYTIDGSTPTTSSTLYTTSFTVTNSCTVKAFATKDGFTDSEVASETISIRTVTILLQEDFETNTLGQMTQYNVAGDNKEWGTAQYGGNYYAFLNAFNGGANEDWLLTPQLTPASGGMTLTFRSATRYDGNALQLKYSTNYTGSGNPNNATWTDITSSAAWSTGNYTWVPSGDVNIMENSPLYIAFIYTSTETQAAAWEVDDIVVTTSGSSTPAPSLTILSPANGTNYSTLDTLNINLDIQNFNLGTDGLLKVESNLLTEAGLPSPYYMDAITWSVFQNMAFSPLPAGTFSATVSLVGLDSLPLATPVTASTTFTVTAPVLSTPTITVTGTEAGAANTYYFTANVAIAAENGASVYYTIDGTTPDANATLYSAPFDVTTSCTVQAIAVKANYANSTLASAIIVIDTPTVAAPTFNPASGVFTDSVVVSIVNDDSTATVHYTTDGSEPTESSATYTEPITLTATTTIKAKAFKTNWHASDMVEATYTIVNEPILTVTPSALTFNSSTLTNNITVSAAYINNPIVLTCSNTHFTLSNDTLANGNSTVTVTFDGTEPATGIIIITADTLSAQVALTATATLPTPTFTPASGATDTLIEVAIACANANASIYYTTDGTTPDANATLYSAPVVLNTVGDHTIKAIAILTNWGNSEVATATYTIVAPVPPAPIYNDTLAYYTGFEPTEGFTPGNVYNSINENLDGPAAHQWATVYGTVSYNSAINDTSSMQLRWYTNSPNNIGYTRSNFDISHATRIQFNAKANRNANVLVSYSTDGGNTYVDSVFTLTSYPQTYNWVISETAEFDNVRFKFAISLPSETPAGRVDLVIDSVCIYNFPSIISGTVEMPVISPNGGFVYDPVQVAITCPTENASIYYTTDGTEPNMNSSLYSAPFTVSSTTTVKAKAFKAGYDASNVASATYTFPIEVANIAAFKAANTTTNNTVYKITGDVTFVFENGANFYIQDATGGLLVYDNQNNNVITRTYTEGDVISGGVYGTYTLYNGLVEMVPTHDLAAATSNTGTVSPVIATVSNIINSYDQFESRLVKLEDVTFTEGGTFTTSSATNMTIGQDNETMQVRNVFKTLDMTIDADATADVTGFVLRYINNNNVTNYQIAPRDNNDIVLSTVEMDTVATPVITVNPLTNNMVSVEITCATDGATIYYTLDGTEPGTTTSTLVYGNAFVHPDEEFTIMAMGYKIDMMSSPVVTYHYIPVGINEHKINVSVYPNPTTGQFRIQNSELRIQSVEVYDVFGKLISNTEVNDNDVTVDISNYTNGVYFTRIRTENGTVTKKVVKQ